MEKRVDKIEDMLSQLIKMVAKTNEEQAEFRKSLNEMKSEQLEMKREQLEMKREQLEMKREQLEMKREQQEMRNDLNETKELVFNLDKKMSAGFNEILDQFKILKVDQEVTWEKLSRLERDVELLKKTV